MQLIDQKNPILLEKCKKFDFKNPPFEPIEFSKELVKFMYEVSGIGLAAPQIGIPYAIFSMRGSPENFVCFNPKIVSASDELIELDEGCLTYSAIFFKIKRPRNIRVRFTTPNGDTITKQFSGLTARIFQHEMDHMEGKRFFDSISRLKIESAFKKANKKGYKYTFSDFNKKELK